MKPLVDYQGPPKFSSNQHWAYSILFEWCSIPRYCSKRHTTKINYRSEFELYEFRINCMIFDNNYSTLSVGLIMTNSLFDFPSGWRMSGDSGQYKIKRRRDVFILKNIFFSKLPSTEDPLPSLALEYDGRGPRLFRSAWTRCDYTANVAEPTGVATNPGKEPAACEITAAAIHCVTLSTTGFCRPRLLPFHDQSISGGVTSKLWSSADANSTLNSISECAKKSRVRVKTAFPVLAAFDEFVRVYALTSI